VGGDLSDSAHLAQATQDIHRQLDPGPDLDIGDDLRSGERVDAQVFQRRGRADLTGGHTADLDDGFAQRNVEIHRAVPPPDREPTIDPHPRP
jgi:hypothetical protein